MMKEKLVLTIFLNFLLFSYLISFILLSPLVHMLTAYKQMGLFFTKQHQQVIKTYK